MEVANVVQRVALIEGSIINQLKEMTEVVRTDPSIKLAINSAGHRMLIAEPGHEEHYARNPRPTAVASGVMGIINEVRVHSDIYADEGQKSFSTEEEPTAWLMKRVFSFGEVEG